MNLNIWEIYSILKTKIKLSNNNVSKKSGSRNYLTSFAKDIQFKSSMFSNNFQQSKQLGRVGRHFTKVSTSKKVRSIVW